MSRGTESENPLEQKPRSRKIDGLAAARLQSTIIVISWAFAVFIQVWQAWRRFFQTGSSE
jgi:hypothetical protein